MICRKSYIVFFTAFLFMSGLAVPAKAQAKPRQILVLYSYNSSIPLYEVLDPVIRDRFIPEFTNLNSLHFEFLGLTRNTSGEYKEKLLQLLQMKYGQAGIELIITVNSPALEFMLDFGRRLFPETPSIFSSVGELRIQNIDLGENITGIVTTVNQVEGTLRAALRIQPKTKTVAVISGTSDTDVGLFLEAQSVIPKFDQELDFLFFQGDTFSQIREKVAGLPENSICLYLTLFRDGTGRTFIPRDAMNELSKVANAPMYGIFNNLIGHGIIGGYLEDFEKGIDILVDMAVQIFAGKKAAEIPLKKSVSSYMFDWRQLRRWHVRESSLPDESLVLFKETTFWQAYKGRILVLVFLLLVALVSILLLLINLKRRKVAEAALTQAHAELEKRVELRTKELKIREETLQSIFRAAPIGIGMVVNRELMKVNQRLCEMLGFTESELIGKNSRLVYPSDEEFEFVGREKYRQISAQGTGTVETKFKRKDGTIIDVLLSSTPLERDDLSQGVTFTALDITERNRAEAEKKQLQVQFQHSQRLESIGTLAGGIAHDFNNILAAILGYTEMGLLETEKDSVIYDYLQEIFKSSCRARDLIKQILAFSRQQKPEFTLAQVRPIAQDVMKLLRASLPVTVEIRMDIRTDATVWANPTKIHQVLMNLGTNAGQAMLERGGLLEIVVEEREVKASEDPRYKALNDGLYLAMTVTDTGHGMTQDVLERIFDPFFTTRENGQGTGLGLSVVHGIVTAYGGLVTATSKPTRGSAFEVLIPVAGNKVEMHLAEEESIPRGTEHILFVDDEELLVKIAGRILENLGYTVTRETSSVRALELFRSEPSRFDLVITDMTMPDLTGDKLSLQILKIRPDIPIILCTGFSETFNEQKAAALGISAYMLKPILKQHLAETVRSLLDGGK